MNRSCYLGFDPREAAAFGVCRHEINRRDPGLPVRGLVLNDLRRRGLYWRQHETRMDPSPAGPVARTYDVISDAPMSTEFAISRFLTPFLARSGLASFMDCDILPRVSMADIFSACDLERGKYAVWCVKHDHRPPEGVKMDGQAQLRYARKNWSSVCVFDCDHPANFALTPEVVNSRPGRDLHAFCWLQDSEIGDLPPGSNFLVGHTAPSTPANLVHFTEGLPNVPGYENVPFAQEWRDALERWAL